MKKITDQDYRLPEIYPLRFDEELPSSANKPIVIGGVDKETGEKGNYVIKFKAANRMSVEASMRELLASFIAMQMEIPIVDPAIIDIDKNFVGILKGSDAWSVAGKSLGYNYGSRYIKDYPTIILNKEFNTHQFPYAQDIFAFDMFIQNSDRTNNKPNMLTNGEEIVILDHEIAFGFVFSPFVTSNIWEMNEQHKGWIRGHCLLPMIKGKAYNYKNFSDKFDTLTQGFWNKAFELIPEDWRTNQFDTIKNILIEICVNRKYFIEELKKIMS